MIFEKIELNIDINKLKAHFKRVVQPLPPKKQVEYWKGWSILSSDGDYRDGWFSTTGAFIQGEGGKIIASEEYAKHAKTIGAKPFTEYWKPTQICTGYLAEITAVLCGIGFYPRRGRVLCMPAGGSTLLHADAPETEYAVRLHIPMITNTRAVLASEGEEEHIPADGNGYLLRVNRFHQGFNRGESDRYG